MREPGLKLIERLSYENARMEMALREILAAIPKPTLTVTRQISEIAKKALSKEDAE